MPESRKSSASKKGSPAPQVEIKGDGRKSAGIPSIIDEITRLSSRDDRILHKELNPKIFGVTGLNLREKSSFLEVGNSYSDLIGSSSYPLLGLNNLYQPNLDSGVSGIDFSPKGSPPAIKYSDLLSERAADVARITEDIAKQISALKVDLTAQQSKAVKEFTAKLAEEQKALLAAAEVEKEREARAEAAFWQRRSILSLQIGHGAALVAVVGSLLQADSIVAAANLAFAPATWFGGGLVAAGSLPFLLWASSGNRTVNARAMLSKMRSVLTVLSALAFPVGVIVALIGIAKAGDHPSVDAHGANAAHAAPIVPKASAGNPPAPGPAQRSSAPSLAPLALAHP